MYKQVIEPNYTAKGKAGWCLSVQQDNWGTPHLYLTAKGAWDAAKYKHQGERPPANIHALCYWTYRENGIDYWHVATCHPNGQVFSSPFDSSYGNQWFSSIDAQTARIQKLYPPAQYVGWAEDLSNVRLVKGEDMIEAGDVAPVRIIMSEVEGWNGNDIHSGKYDKQIMAAWTGQKWQDFIYHGFVAQKAHRQNLTDTIAKLSAQVADLSKRPTQAELDALKQAASDAQAQADAAIKSAADAKEALANMQGADSVAQDTNTKVNWLVTMFQKIFK